MPRGGTRDLAAYEPQALKDANGQPLYTFGLISDSWKYIEPAYQYGLVRWEKKSGRYISDFYHNLGIRVPEPWWGINKWDSAYNVEMYDFTLSFYVYLFYKAMYLTPSAMVDTNGDLYTLILESFPINYKEYYMCNGQGTRGPAFRISKILGTQPQKINKQTQRFQVYNPQFFYALWEPVWNTGWYICCGFSAWLVEAYNRYLSSSNYVNSMTWCSYGLSPVLAQEGQENNSLYVIFLSAGQSCNLMGLLKFDKNLNNIPFPGETSSRLDDCAKISTTYTYDVFAPYNLWSYNFADKIIVAAYYPGTFNDFSAVLMGNRLWIFQPITLGYSKDQRAFHALSMSLENGSITNNNTLFKNNDINFLEPVPLGTENRINSRILTYKDNFYLMVDSLMEEKIDGDRLTETFRYDLRLSKTIREDESLRYATQDSWREYADAYYGEYTFSSIVRGNDNKESSSTTQESLLSKQNALEKQIEQAKNNMYRDASSGKTYEKWAERYKQEMEEALERYGEDSDQYRTAKLNYEHNLERLYETEYYKYKQEYEALVAELEETKKLNNTQLAYFNTYCRNNRAPIDNDFCIIEHEGQQILCFLGLKNNAPLASCRGNNVKNNSDLSPENGWANGIISWNPGDLAGVLYSIPFDPDASQKIIRYDDDLKTPPSNIIYTMDASVAKQTYYSPHKFVPYTSPSSGHTYFIYAYCCPSKSKQLYLGYAPYGVKDGHVKLFTKFEFRNKEGNSFGGFTSCSRIISMDLRNGHLWITFMNSDNTEYHYFHILAKDLVGE